MKLGVLDRLLILNILPKEGNIITLRLIRDIIQKVGLSDKELKDLKMKQIDNGRVTWDNSKEIIKDINLGESAIGIISDEFKRLNKDKKLTMEHMNVYDKFVKDGD